MLFYCVHLAPTRLRRAANATAKFYFIWGMCLSCCAAPVLQSIWFSFCSSQNHVPWCNEHHDFRRLLNHMREHERDGLISCHLTLTAETAQWCISCIYWYSFSSFRNHCYRHNSIEMSNSSSVRLPCRSDTTFVYRRRTTNPALLQQSAGNW